MPRMFLRHVPFANTIDLEIPHQIERDFNVSILTAAIRVTELTREPCGAVLAKDGKVRWFAKSETMPFRIEVGRLLSCDSLASHFFVDQRVDEEPRRVPARAWFETNSVAEIVEHAFC